MSASREDTPVDWEDRVEEDDLPDREQSAPSTGAEPPSLSSKLPEHALECPAPVLVPPVKASTVSQEDLAKTCAPVYPEVQACGFVPVMSSETDMLEVQYLSDELTAANALIHELIQECHDMRLAVQQVFGPTPTQPFFY